MASIKLMILLTAKDGMTQEQFRHHYETSHAPLAVRLFPMIKEYRRNFLDRGEVPLKPGATAPDFDVITELVFANEADYEAFLKRRAEPEVDVEVSADEERFTKRYMTRKLLVTEKRSKG